MATTIPAPPQKVMQNPSITASFDEILIHSYKQLIAKRNPAISIDKRKMKIIVEKKY